MALKWSQRQLRGKLMWVNRIICLPGSKRARGEAEIHSDKFNGLSPTACTHFQLWATQNWTELAAQLNQEFNYGFLSWPWEVQQFPRPGPPPRGEKESLNRWNLRPHLYPSPLCVTCLLLRGLLPFSRMLLPFKDSLTILLVHLWFLMGVLTAGYFTQGQEDAP